MTKARQQTGSWGEQLACEYLEQKDYQILDRNYRSKFGELDIVARNGEYLVFCEVKTRNGKGSIHPTAAITPRKIRKLRQLGQLYIQQKKIYYLQPRFDVVAIQMPTHEPPIIEHFINAL